MVSRSGHRSCASRSRSRLAHPVPRVARQRRMRKPSRSAQHRRPAVGVEPGDEGEGDLLQGCLRSCKRPLRARKLKRFLSADQRTSQSRPRSPSSSLISGVSLASQPSKPCRVGLSAGAGSSEARDAAVAALLQPLEVVAHGLGVPGLVAGQLGDAVPVAVVGVDEDHGVVRGAPAQRAGARVEDAVAPPARTCSPSSAARRRVVAHEEVARTSPAPRRRWDGTPAPGRLQVSVAVSRIASGLEHQNRWPARARSAASGPPPAPEPTTMYSYSSSKLTLLSRSEVGACAAPSA